MNLTPEERDEAYKKIKKELEKLPKGNKAENKHTDKDGKEWKRLK